MSDLLLESVLVCPVCGFAKRETMPLTPANSSTSALAAKRCFDPKQAIVASFALMAP
jgi:hypothetical protein